MHRIIIPQSANESSVSPRYFSVVFSSPFFSVCSQLPLYSLFLSCLLLCCDDDDDEPEDDDDL